MAKYTRLTNLDITGLMGVGGVITAPAGVVGNITGNVTGAITGNVTGYALKSATVTAVATTGGAIPAGVTHVTVISAAAANIIILPTPVAGLKITLYVGANGYELKSSAPATISINGGAGAAVSSSVAASMAVKVECTSSTTWIASTVTGAGVVDVLEVAV